MRIYLASLLVLGIMLSLGGQVHASETDQYLVWGKELRDCSDALNRYLNGELETFLAIQNRKPDKVKSSEQLVKGYYSHVFSGLNSSRLRDWLHSSPEVDRFPDKSINYFKHHAMSIYRGHAFPVFIPMSRTVRVGEIYMGIDKLCHFFGFGRRYFGQFLRLTNKGQDEETAARTVIRRGIVVERIFVGGLVDGVLSFSDLEANYQGMQMARHWNDVDAPFFARHRGLWVATREIDIIEYMTPGLDESYNPPLYTGPRAKNIPRIIRDEYAEKLRDPSLLARFAKYNRWERSLTSEVIEEYFASRRPQPRVQQLGAEFVDFSSPMQTSAVIRPQTLRQD